ncbi:hypothetical protein C8F01DRAFT_1259830 [Mycena amicta]|nr:hypothetical protein C8F01DRAFT_1259830 [Mycena amicta]
MRDKGVMSIRRALPRMSWHPKNLFNLWQRMAGPKHADITFRRSEQKLFQQRWVAKAVVRAYHGDLIGEKIFKAWYLPEHLPDVRPRRKVFGDDGVELGDFARRKRKAEREAERGRRGTRGELDVLIFRCCFAPSIYEARRLVIHGNVLLNGKKHSNANTRLAPGDMFSVRPSAMLMLRPQKTAGESDNITARPDAPPDLTPFNLPFYASPWLFIPAYVEVSFPTCSAIYVRHPTARPQYSEIPTPYDADGEVIRAAWEWYLQNRSRKRTEWQWSRMPDDRLRTQMEERRLGSNSIKLAVAQASRSELR